MARLVGRSAPSRADAAWLLSSPRILAMNRRPGRISLRVLSTLGLVLAVVLTALSTWSVTDDLRGSETSAEVVDIEHRGDKIFLTVRFTTNRGDVCQSSLRAEVPANRSVRIGQGVNVHHAKSSPCLRVREADDQFWWLVVVPGVILLTAFSILSYVAWLGPGLSSRSATQTCPDRPGHGRDNRCFGVKRGRCANSDLPDCRTAGERGCRGVLFGQWVQLTAVHRINCSHPAPRSSCP